MQAPGGPEEDPTSGFRFGGWVVPFWDESMGRRSSKIIEADYDLLLGKRTYDIFAAYWPYNQDNPIGEQVPAHQQICADPFRRAAGVGEQPQAVGRHRRRRSRELKQSEGRDLLIQGSSTLYPPLLSAG